MDKRLRAVFTVYLSHLLYALLHPVHSLYRILSCLFFPSDITTPPVSAYSPYPLFPISVLLALTNTASPPNFVALAVTKAAPSTPTTAGVHKTVLHCLQRPQLHKYSSNIHHVFCRQSLLHLLCSSLIMSPLPLLYLTHYSRFF